MLYRTGLQFSTGLKKSIMIKKSTMEYLERHKEWLIKEFGGIDVRAQNWLKHFPNKDHWSNPDAGNNKLCSMARHQNYFVRHMYYAMRDDRNAKDVELVKLTPKKASSYWPMFHEVTIPPNRWSAEYYKEEMNELMLVLQGKGDDYVTFEAPPLTLEQAAQVVIAFDHYLDKHDIRLTLPRGCDELYPSEECQYCLEMGEDFLENDMDDYECRRCKNKDCDYGLWIREQYEEEEKEDE